MKKKENERWRGRLRLTVGDGKQQQQQQAVVRSLKQVHCGKRKHGAKRAMSAYKGATDEKTVIMCIFRVVKEIICDLKFRHARTGLEA